VNITNNYLVNHRKMLVLAIKNGGMYTAPFSRAVF